MAWPFLTKEDFECTPRKVRAQRTDLEPAHKEILDAVDISEQIEAKLIGEAIVSRRWLIIAVFASLDRIVVAVRWAIEFFK